MTLTSLYDIYISLFDSISYHLGTSSLSQMLKDLRCQRLAPHTTRKETVKVFTVFIVFLFIFSLPLPGLVMNTLWKILDRSRWRGIATTWATTMAYAVAVSVQVYAVMRTRSMLMMAIVIMSLFLNLLALQGIGEEEEEES